jgi:hypothetical protein
LFSHSDVNIGVLPFTTEAPNPDITYGSNTYTSGLQGRNQTATQLARIIQLDTLYSLRYPAGMGVVHFQGPPEACQSDAVVSRILAASEGQGLNDGKGLVTYWGRFLTVGDALYAQSFMRFFRRGIGEFVELRLGKGAQALRLSSRMSRQAVSFSARLLAEEDLRAVEQGFERASIIWADRVGDEESGRLPQDPEEGFAFSVSDVDPVTGRMHIQPYKFFNAPSGWIKARVDPEAWPLRTKLPELSFLNALTGYLGFRVVELERPEPNWAGQWPRRLVRARDRAAVAFRDYRRYAVPTLNLDSLPLAALTARGGDRGVATDIPAAERAALGWSHGLTAVMDLILSTLEPIGPERRAVAASDAKRAIERAVALVSSDPDLLNLAALIEVRECCFDGNLSAVKAAEGYLRRALAVDPGHRDSIRNLAQIYKVLEVQDAAGAIGLTEDQLSRRRATLARVVAQIKEATLDPSQPTITIPSPNVDRDQSDEVGDGDGDADCDHGDGGQECDRDHGESVADDDGDDDEDGDDEDSDVDKDGKDDPDSNGTGTSESNSRGQKGHGKDSGSGNDDSTVGTDWSRGEDKCCRGHSFKDVNSGDPGKSQGKNSGRDN